MQKINIKLVMKLALTLAVVIAVGVMLQKAIHKASLDKMLNDFKGKILTLESEEIACDSKEAMRTWHYHERRLNYNLMVSSTAGHCDSVGAPGYKLKALNAELLDETHKIEDELLIEVTGAASPLTSSGLYIRQKYNE